MELQSFCQNTACCAVSSTHLQAANAGGGGVQVGHCRAGVQQAGLVQGVGEGGRNVCAQLLQVAQVRVPLQHLAAQEAVSAALHMAICPIGTHVLCHKGAWTQLGPMSLTCILQTSQGQPHACAGCLFSAPSLEAKLGCPTKVLAGACTALAQGALQALQALLVGALRRAAQAVAQTQLRQLAQPLAALPTLPEGLCKVACCQDFPACPPLSLVHA